MIDESMDKEQLKQPPKEWEFRSKPAWQRLIIMLGGIIMNVLVAFVIYAFILMTWLQKKSRTPSMNYGVQIEKSVLYKNAGMRTGDVILTIEAEPINDFDKL